MYCTESEWNNPTQRKIYGTFLIFVQFIVPLIVITNAYCTIALYNHRSTAFYKRVSLQSSMERRKSLYLRKRTNRMLAAMIISFAAASAPLLLINILNDYEAMPKFIQKQQYFVSSVGHLTFVLTIVIDPILYVIMNKKFRGTVLRAMRCEMMLQMRKISSSLNLKRKCKCTDVPIKSERFSAANRRPRESACIVSVF